MIRVYSPSFTAVQHWSQRRLAELTQTDTTLLFLTMVFAATSCAVLYSASQEQFDIVQKQIQHFILGIVILVVLALQKPQRFMDAAPWFYLASMLLLVAVLFVGDTTKGAQRWLNFGVVRFQPAELLKLTVPLMLCFIYHVTVSHAVIKHILAGVALALPIVLISLQPDLGTALLIGISGYMLIFLAGIHWGFIVSSFAAAAAAAPLIWHNMHEYQQQRVLTFFSPDTNILNTGYHTMQSKIAIGSGGLWGKGWLSGTQSQLEFVPEQTTDFLFSVIAEEFGFIGAILVLLLYLLTMFRGVAIALRAKLRFCRLLAAALSISLFIYFFANIGMVSGLIPVVGTPLPLLSYGGTSIIIFCATLGILMALSRSEYLLLNERQAESE